MTAFRLTISTAALIAAAWGLAACNRSPSQPPPAAPLAAEAAAPMVAAPAAEALPSAPPAPVARSLAPRYQQLDRAYALSDVLGDAPPDYAFDYDGVEPWTWRTQDGYVLVSERLGSGWRYYYYEPGADLPFLVRDPDYAYGYDRGSLVVVYDHDGRPQGDVRPRADVAGRYLARARALRQASNREQRAAPPRTAWAAERRSLEADRDRLSQQQQASPEWRDYHQAETPTRSQRWAEERTRRESEAARAREQANTAPNGPSDRPRDDRGADRTPRDREGKGTVEQRPPMTPPPITTSAPVQPPPAAPAGASAPPTPHTRPGPPAVETDHGRPPATGPRPTRPPDRRPAPDRGKPPTPGAATPAPPVAATPAPDAAPAAKPGETRSDKPPRRAKDDRREGARPD